MEVAVPLAKNILSPLGITAASSTIDGEFIRKYMALEQQL